MFRIVVLFLFLLIGSIASAQIQIVAFGDSLLAGYGLADEEGFVPQMQRYLEEKGVDAVVQNFAISGDTTADGLNRLTEVENTDSDIILLGLGSNDALRNISASTAYTNLATILDRLISSGAQILLLGAQAPLNYGSSYKEKFDGIFTRLAREKDIKLYPFILEGVALDQRYVLNDGLHPNPAGILIMVNRVGREITEMLSQKNN